MRLEYNETLIGKKKLAKIARGAFEERVRQIENGEAEPGITVFNDPILKDIRMLAKYWEKHPYILD
jgi:hypothetical protein